jgi:NAD(P)-dependent dehydrogenase (short-subunit alcohol dehydrogenase family)
MGRAIWQALSRRGARIVAVDIDGKSAQETVAILSEEGAPILAVEADVSDPDAVQTMCDVAIQPMLGGPAVQRRRPCRHRSQLPEPR